MTAWPGRPGDVQHVAFKNLPAKKVSLEPRTDARGRWYFGTAESRSPSRLADAGAFVAVCLRWCSPPSKPAQKVVDALAPLKAAREVGRIESARGEEFGFKQPGVHGHRGHRRQRASSPRWVGPRPTGAIGTFRDEATSVVYSTHGDFLRDVELGDMGLSERDVHDFQDPDILSVRIVGGGKSREVLRRGPTSKRIWSDPSSPDKADETVSNWLNKVDRLHAPRSTPRTFPRAA